MLSLNLTQDILGYIYACKANPLLSLMVGVGWREVGGWLRSFEVCGLSLWSLHIFLLVYRCNSLHVFSILAYVTFCLSENSNVHSELSILAYVTFCLSENSNVHSELSIQLYLIAP